MLVEFRVENFRSFREEQVLSLVAGRDKRHESNCIPLGEDGKLLKTAVIYGANASGKSNLISALGWMKHLVRASATEMTQGDRIHGVEPFRLDRDFADRPSKFTVVVLIDGFRCDYTFAATSDRVHEETLRVTPPNQRRQTWLSRRFDGQTGRDSWRFRAALGEYSKLLKERTRPNGLALSRGAELNVEPLMPLYAWFREELHVTDMSQQPPDSLIAAAEQLADNDKLRGKVEELLRHADVGISALEIATTNEVKPPDELPPGLVELLSPKGIANIRENWERQLKHRLYAHHPVRQGGTQRFRFEEGESEGTQRFVTLLLTLLDAMEKGTVVVADEIDCSMHPHLLRKLIELFQLGQRGRKGAQLICATHDSTLLDEALLRRDQLWFVEKPGSGASMLYSLYDFRGKKGKMRSDSAFERNYRAGRYGAVPVLGPALEDPEL